MSQPLDIQGLSKNVESVTLSTSPQTSPFENMGSASLGSYSRQRRLSTNQRAKVLKPFSTGDIKILLLENVNKTAVEIFSKQGYQVEFVSC
jgi:D-3-phosphoglycerate dehydrogenase